MRNGPNVKLAKARGHASCGENILIFPENRGQPTDLCAKSSPDMLGLIRHKLFYAGHDFMKKGLWFKKTAKAYKLNSEHDAKTVVLPQLTWNLPRNCTADFCFGVLEQLHKSGYEISVDHLLINGFCNLGHISGRSLPFFGCPTLTFSNRSATM